MSEKKKQKSKEPLKEIKLKKSEKQEKIEKAPAENIALALKTMMNQDNK